MSLETRAAELTNSGKVPLRQPSLVDRSGARMKGFTLLHLMTLMDEREPGASALWQQTLTDELRGETDRRLITSVSWVPFEAYYDGVGWLARRHYGGPRGALHIGHVLASRDIGAFFRFIFSMTSASTVMQLGGRFWRSYFDRSSLHVLRSSPNDVQGEVRDWPCNDEAALYELQGSLVAWIEASKAKDMRVQRFELVEPGLVKFEASWR